MGRLRRSLSCPQLIARKHNAYGQPRPPACTADRRHRPRPISQRFPSSNRAEPPGPRTKEIEDTLPLPDCFSCGRPRVSCLFIEESLAVWKTRTDCCYLLYVRQRCAVFRGLANIREFSTLRALAFSWYRVPRRNRRQDQPTGPVGSVGHR
jgi:hypothetical protein